MTVRHLLNQTSGFVDRAAHRVVQESLTRELLIGVRAAAEGAAYLSPKIAHRVVADLRGGRLTRYDKRTAALTGREREVLALVGEGLSNQDIARRLTVVEGTVKAHVSTILQRLGVTNRVQAAILAYEAGLTTGR